MSKPPRPHAAKPAAKPAAPAKPKPVEHGIAPLFALHKIRYGKAQTAPSKSLFVPVNEKERDEILALNAAREPTETELAVFGGAPAPTGNGAAAVDDAAPAGAAAPDGVADGVAAAGSSDDASADAQNDTAAADGAASGDDFG